jgi:3D-(3,5/4)-trihydroxycyclohexane-1,2-dione acylhydrolase (decyclizing)
VNPQHRQTVRMTAGQAIIRYLSRQYSEADGERRRLIPATLGIFGHGNVAGLGQALDQFSDVMPFAQGRSEQALVHAATGYAKHARRRATLAVTAPSFTAALDQVRRAACEHGKACGLLVADGAAAATRLAEGWTFAAIGSDATLLATAVTSTLAQARARAGTQGKKEHA